MQVIAILAVVSVVAACFALLIVRERLRMLRRYRSNAATFFDNAELVLNSGVAPKEFCATIRFVANRIDDTRTAQVMFKVMRGAVNNVANEVQQEFERREFLFEELEHKHPEVAKAYVTALAAGMLAAMNMNLVYGGLIRFGLGRLIKRHRNWSPAFIMDSQAASGKLFNNVHSAPV